MGSPCCKSSTDGTKLVEQLHVADDMKRQASGDWQRQITEYEHGVRTQADDSVPASKALEKLKAGNTRYCQGKKNRIGSKEALTSLANFGQMPFAAIIGCADSRCPVETLFDAQPGDLFVLRNAGNTCTNAAASIIGSTEYCIGHLRTNFVLVLGHTKCGAIAGATNVALSGKDSEATTALDSVLIGLGPVAKKAAEELGKDASIEAVAAHAVKVNVFNTIENLLTFSQALKDKVASGDLQVQGAIYDIMTGEVNFLGPCPRQETILKSSVPPIDQCSPCAGA